MGLADYILVCAFKYVTTLCVRAVKVLTRLRGCAAEPSLLAIRTKYNGSYVCLNHSKYVIKSVLKDVYAEIIHYIKPCFSKCYFNYFVDETEMYLVTALKMNCQCQINI